MKHFFLPLLAAFLLTGCAIAAGAAGSSIQSRGEDVEYYLKTNEVEREIEICMRDSEVCEGMTPTQVRLVMGSRVDYPTEPQSTMSVGDEERWTFESHDSGMPTITVHFEDGEVIGSSEELE